MRSAYPSTAYLVPNNQRIQKLPVQGGGIDAAKTTASHIGSNPLDYCFVEAPIAMT
jgi:hypothetical protein